MIQSIGFKNFRRFENFPDMELGKINIFVGRNNAGKSTVMKAIELFKGNLKHLSYVSSQDDDRSSRPVFAFDTEETAEIHIDNFERALYKHAIRREITLTAGYNGYHVEIVLDGVNMKKEDSFVSVPYSSVHFWNGDMDVFFDFNTRHLVADFMNVAATNYGELQKVKRTIRTLVNIKQRLTRDLENLSTLSHSSTSEDIVKIASSNLTRKRIETQLKRIDKDLELNYGIIKKAEEAEKKNLHIDIENMPEFPDNMSLNIFSQVFEDMLEFSNMDIEIDGRTTIGQKIQKTQELILEYFSFFTECSRQVRVNLTSFLTEYIPAHAASQKVIYLKEDKNDFLSATLSSFCRLHFYKKDTEWQFIRKWMDTEHFGIGYDFSIDDIQGAGYMVKILDDKHDKEGINLADKGVGTIQLMTLLLRLAVVMRESRYGSTILIEEPEQNIHPMLQEKLADLLLDFHDECEKRNRPVQLVVETHSECLTRRIQGIVADANYKDDEDLKNNPFNIYYFDSYSKETPWYRMEFEITGGFKPGCQFGPGFYDTAANLDMRIIEKEQSTNLFDF